MSKKAPKGEYIETDTGNKVSRKSQIIGTTNIILGGKTVIQAEVIIRGDLLRTLPASASADGAKHSNVAVAIGRYCILSRGCCLRPPGKLYKGFVATLLVTDATALNLTFLHRAFSHYPLKMGDHVFVGPGSIVEAALIGNHVSIGQGCIIGKFAIIKDFVRILDGTVVPANMVIPSFSIVAGRPGRIIGEVPEGGQDSFDCRDIYRSIG